MLGGLDGVVSDFNATAVAALPGGEERLLGFGGAAEALGIAAVGAAGRHEPPAGAAGFGATDGVAGADVAGAAGFGGVEALVAGAAATGARDGVAEAGFATSGGAGIDVSPVAGPGPSGGGGCTGIVVEGAGGASSRHAKPSASKLRSVLRPQMGQSQPTSKRFWCASMLCAGARSRTRSRPIAKPDKT